MTNDYVVRFRNTAQVVLYECEFKGQFSDGNWENTMPYDHWEIPCKAKAVVGEPGEKLGPANFWPRVLYGFSSPDLLSCIGDRMLFFVRYCAAFLPTNFDAHWDWEKWGEAFVEGEVSPEEQSKFTAACRAYSMADLKRDLKDMSRIWAGKGTIEEEKAEKAAQEARDREYEAKREAEYLAQRLARRAALEAEFQTAINSMDISKLSYNQISAIMGELKR